MPQSPARLGVSVFALRPRAAVISGLWLALLVLALACSATPPAARNSPPAGRASSACPAVPADIASRGKGAAEELLLQYLTRDDLLAAGYSPGDRAAVLLHVTAAKGCLEYLRHYVQTYGTGNLELRSPTTMTPLHLAVVGGHVDVVDYLLSVGANSRATTSVVLLGGSETPQEARVATVNAMDLARLHDRHDIADRIRQRRPWWKPWIR